MRPTAEPSCPNCGDASVSTFYRQSDVPVHSALLLFDRERARNYPTGNIELAVCGACGFIFNRAFDPGLLEYEASYEGSQAFSSTFGEFHHRLAGQLIEKCDLRGRKIAEIGCGRGEFLDLLCSLGDNRGVGFEPSSVDEPGECERNDRYQIVRDFFPREGERLDADFVCCKMTLEHIARPADLVRAIVDSCPPQHAPEVFFQVPESGRIFREGAFWDIYYEHCSYFCAAALAALFERSGFAIDDQWSDYDGQYLMQIARPAARRSSPTDRRDQVREIVSAAETFADRSAAAIASWRERIKAVRGPVVLWGAGSKAVAFLAATGIAQRVPCLVDINPHKHGTYAPGTGLPIVAPATVKDVRPSVVVAMNPIYRGEIAADLRAIGIGCELWTL